MEAATSLQRTALRTGPVEKAQMLVTARDSLGYKAEEIPFQRNGLISHITCPLPSFGDDFDVSGPAVLGIYLLVRKDLASPLVIRTLCHGKFHDAVRFLRVAFFILTVDGRTKQHLRERRRYVIARLSRSEGTAGFPLRLKTLYSTSRKSFMVLGKRL